MPTDGLEIWMTYTKANSRLAPRQWETVLQCNTISHWLGTNLGSALIYSGVPSYISSQFSQNPYWTAHNFPMMMSFVSFVSSNPDLYSTSVTEMLYSGYISTHPAVYVGPEFETLKPFLYKLLWKMWINYCIIKITAWSFCFSSVLT